MVATKALASTSGVKMAYPNGGIRITRTPGRRQAKNCINLDDLINKRDLTSACIYSFFIADEEILPYFPLSRSSNSPPVSLVLSP